MSATLNDYTVTQSWTDVVATLAAASASSVFQNVGAGEVQIVFGGTSAPTGKTGIVLNPMDSVQGAASNVWVKAASGSVLSVMTV